MKTHPEFCDYPIADLPPMPTGFADSSWHNDTCPSYIDEDRGLRIFIDYADKAQREYEHGKRFLLARETEKELVTIINSDDWNDILGGLK